MKKSILIALLVLITSISFCQSWQTQAGTYSKPDGMWPAKVFRLPSDTTTNKTGLVVLNAVLYIGDGAKWSRIASGAITTETDPTVPLVVKAITSGDIASWNDAVHKAGTETITGPKTLANNLTFSGGTNLGIRWDGGNTGIDSRDAINRMYFYTNAIERLRIWEDGLVSIPDRLTISNATTAGSFIKSGGVSTEFLKADGSVDNSTYLTSSYTGFDSRYSKTDGSNINQSSFRTALGLGSNAYTSTSYLPTAGGTMTGLLTVAEGVGIKSSTTDGGFYAVSGYMYFGKYSSFSGLRVNTVDGNVQFTANVGIGESSPVNSLGLGSGSTGIGFYSSNKTFNSGKIAEITHVELGSGNGDLVFTTYGGGGGGAERLRLTGGGIAKFSGDIRGGDIIVSRGSGVGGMFVSTSVGGVAADTYLYFDGTTWKVGGGDAAYASLIHAQNIGTVALALNGSTPNVVNLISQFTTNKGATTHIAATDNGTLQAYNTDGGAAFMSFHRVGNFAVNMGLDYDNKFVIGGWSASELFSLDMSGNLSLASDINSVNANVAGYVKSNTYKNSTGTTQITFNASNNDIAFSGYSQFNNDIEAKAIIYHRSNLSVLNKAANGWLTWASRNSTGSEVNIDLSNIGNINAIGYIATVSNKRLVLDNEGDAWSYLTSSNGTGDIPVTGLVVSSNTAQVHVWSGEDNDYGTIKSSGFILNNGTSAQVLKANGSTSTHAELYIPAVRVNNAAYTATVQNEYIEFYNVPAGDGVNLYLPNPASMSGKRLIVSLIGNSGKVNYEGSYTPIDMYDADVYILNYPASHILISNGVNWRIVNSYTVPL